MRIRPAYHFTQEGLVMADRAESSGSVEGDQIRLSVLTVPRTGSVVVRFLGELRSLWTHFKNGRSYACEGEELCPAAIHRERVFWKAYAPVEYKTARERSAWYPAVLEITEGLSQFLHSDNPRGEVWKLARERVTDKRQECRGHLIRTDDPRKLRRDVLVEAVVSRLYRSNRIAWDMPKPFGEREWLKPTYDAVEDAQDAHIWEQVANRPSIDEARKLLREQLGPQLPRSDAHDGETASPNASRARRKPSADQ